MPSIASSLGIGSGIDTSALIDQLANASRAPKEAVIKQREDANSARISSLASASNGISNFTSALSTLISGGTLLTQPNSSDTSILTASALPGARIGSLSTQIEVRQIAQAQSLVSDYLADATTAPVGKGQLTITTASGDHVITINDGNNSLSGLASAINAAAAGVTASVVNDANGARLIVKGATGSANGFSLTPAADAEPGLARFSYGAATPGMTRAQAAQDAIVKMDGVEVVRASNSLTDLIEGVTIDLKSARPGTSVTLGATRPTASIKQAVQDFAAAYNELKTVLDAATAAGAGGSSAGPLRGDPGIREMQRQLARLTSTTLSSGDGPTTLAEIGVYTNRDGTLGVDIGKLDAILASDPDGVEALFNPTQRSDNPAVKIVSPMGRAKPGTYVLTGLVAATGSTGPSGTIAGKPGLPLAGNRLAASITSPASGLVIEPLANVAGATITVDLGLGGALQQIRDALLAPRGPLSRTQDRLAAEGKTISEDRIKMEMRQTAYRDQLVKSFTAMDSRVTAYKATQSYLEQQIAIWTNGND
ncbi:flagellar hook protein [Sphingomonas oleivorans]|uniref:Flagellar hook-associated protein 2 n=1 Tax=Sphingomonas oleivorans TaxID=1735121 RepID=A0A2T5FYD1_9SPHN|nr:flagellar filament capping protein FliD [Sphingomonas oleivorans]PTQ11535.1 flagellar hook protein [Sphingomonas oleivorans]